MVELDQARQRAELGQVGTEHAGVVHAAERGRHASRGAEHREEEMAELR
jgi:hypothetical protein